MRADKGTRRRRGDRSEVVKLSMGTVVGVGRELLERGGVMKEASLLLLLLSFAAAHAEERKRDSEHTENGDRDRGGNRRAILLVVTGSSNLCCGGLGLRRTGFCSARRLRSMCLSGCGIGGGSFLVLDGVTVRWARQPYASCDGRSDVHDSIDDRELLSPTHAHGQSVLRVIQTSSRPNDLRILRLGPAVLRRGVVIDEINEGNLATVHGHGYVDRIRPLRAHEVYCIA